MAGRPRRDTRDVRNELIGAAVELLSEVDDPAAVSVADLVDLAGCTPPSLYHHFASKDELLRIAAEGHMSVLGADINRAAAGHHGVEALVVRAAAYLDFAIAEPSMYRILFMGYPDGPSSADDLEPGSALVDLADAVRVCLPAERSEEALGIAFGLWAIMHGLSAIHVSNPVIPIEIVRDTLEKSVKAFARGHNLAPLTGE